MSVAIAFSRRWHSRTRIAAERAAIALSRLGVRPPNVPAPLLDTYLAMISARTIMAATSLGVFRALDQQPSTSEELAGWLGLDPLGTHALLTALHALGYLTIHGGSYRNATVARRFLVPGSPQSLDAWVGRFDYDTWASLGQLEACLRDGRDLELHRRAPDDPLWDGYMRGLFQLSRLSAGIVARKVRIRRPERLLDLAGGHGGYSIAMCRRHPGLHATVVELEGAARVGRCIVTEAGMDGRVEFRIGDMLKVDVGSGYDIAMANAILQNLPPEACSALLRRARVALRERGTMVVVELEHPSPGSRGHLASTLASVLFSALTRTRAYTVEELRGWLREAGFRRIRVTRPPRLPGSVILTGRV